MDLFLDDMFDDRYGYRGHFQLRVCKRCCQIETSPLMREEDLPRLYSEYYPRSDIGMGSIAAQVGQPGVFRERVLRWLKGVNNQGQYHATDGSRVLDYGCGTGLSLLEVQRLGGEAYGIETDPNIRSVAEHFGLNIHIGNLDDDPFPDVKFDLIVMNQVIEHVPNPGKLLQEAGKKLAPQGVIILSFPNTGSIYRKLFSRKWINWHIPYHLHHFNLRSFEQFCRGNGFRLEKYRTVTPNLWTDLQLRVRKLEPVMGVPTPLWTGTESEPQRAVKAAFPPRISWAIYKLRAHLVAFPFRLLRQLLILVVNRLVDLLRQGDSIFAIVSPAAGARAKEP